MACSSLAVNFAQESSLIVNVVFFPSHTPESPQVKANVRKPLILTLTTTFPSSNEDPSGVFIAKLLTAVQRMGYDVTVVCPSNGRFHGRRIVLGLQTVRFAYFWPTSLEKLTVMGGGIPENMAKSRLARFQAFTMMVAFLFYAIVESRRCDVLHANWLGAGIVGAMVNLLTRKPLVVTFRGDDGYLARDRPLWRVLTKWVMRRSTFIAPVSRELVDIMRELGAAEPKLKSPTFGVDSEMFKPRLRPQLGNGIVQALFVGSLIPRKGLHDLLRAMNAPELESLHLTVVGEGVYEPELRSLMEKLGVNGRVRMLGLQPPVEVARLMSAADFLCLPTYMEGRPNVVNEAMASGIAVVSTRVGGIPDMVIEGETALLCEPGDIDCLRRSLIQLTHNPELRHHMGRKARSFILESGISWEATATEFADLFSRAIQGDSAAALLESGER